MFPKQKIGFISRAYNDLDTQASLIDEFLQDDAYEVFVVADYFDNDVLITDYYEGKKYLQNKGARFLNVLEDGGNYFTKLVFKAYRGLMRMRRSASNLHLLAIKVTMFGVRAVMVRQATLDKKWPLLVKELELDIIIIDEMVFQKDRSVIVDKVIPLLKSNGTRVFAILTGQNVYFEANPAGSTRKRVYLKNNANKYFLPGPLDSQINKEIFPQEDCVVKGNLRMNPKWISKLYREVLVPPYFNYASYEKDLPQTKYKVVLMLSKPSYGVAVSELQNCISFLAAHPSISLVIKPHTRGMKLDFLDNDAQQRVVVKERIPSSVLCNWADLLLFTGSSIAFHSIIMGKSVGFLGYCQKMRTVFDEHPICYNFSSQEDFEASIQALIHGRRPTTEPKTEVIKNFLVEQLWGGESEGDVPKSYKDAIESAQ